MQRPTFCLLSLAALTGSTLLLSSCDKASDPQSPLIELSAQDQSLAEDETAALSDLTDAAAPADAAVANSPAIDSDDLTPGRPLPDAHLRRRHPHADPRFRHHQLRGAQRRSPAR